ncbi:glycosyltransferase family 4 protein [Thermococcus sp.]|uniref:glycosyltransferase family 4 protein n=1 Tax=Thermococcus sp. TaxID=35749 RepID=UPI00262BC220|nr:glycosyltransferase family 4 protein [Thermococcus sp.]
MRVLLLHNQISPYRLPIFERLNEKFEVTVLFCEPRSPDRLWETEVIKRFNFQWRILKGKRIGKIILNNPIEIIEELKNSDVVVIAETVETIPSTVLALILSRVLKKKVILWTERIESPWISHKFRGPKRILKETYEKAIFFMSNIVAAYSKKSREHALKIGVSPGKLVEGIQIMPSEIFRSQEQDSAKSKIPIKDYNSKLIITYIGYLREPKGVQVLIEAFKQIPYKNIDLIIAGTGPYEQTLKEISKNDKRIHFIGYITGKRKTSVYTHSSIFVLPTFHDSWGLVINESLYYGVPLITTTAAAGSQIIQQEKTGLVLPPGDINALRKALEVLIENPKLIRKMKHVTMKIGKKYSNAELGARHFFKAIQRLHE